MVEIRNIADLLDLERVHVDDVDNRHCDDLAVPYDPIQKRLEPPIVDLTVAVDEDLKGK